MASPEERQETVDALKGQRYYRLLISGYGGEAAYISLSKEAFEFWNNACDEYGDSDLVNYCVTDDPEDYDFEDIGEDADKRNYIVSYDKINQLGFEAKISMNEGIDEILEVLKIMNFDDHYHNAKYF